MSSTLLVAIAGGLGAVLRYVVDGAIARALPGRLPIGTLVVNVSGSFVLGLVTAMAMDRAGLDQWTAVLGTGLLGGYTTFSTASVEAVSLAMADGPRTVAVVRAGGHAAAMLVLGASAAWLGLALG